MEVDGGVWTAARMVGVDLLTSARPESIFRGSDNAMWPTFVEKVARSRKHKKGGPSQNAPTAHAKKRET